MHDILLQGFSTNSENDIWQQILTEHPLQAFSQRYFEQTSESLMKLFSYQAAYCPPDKSEDTNAMAWFEQSLQAPDISWRQLSLNQLNQFYRHPGRYLLQQRLRLRLEFDDELLDPREPFSLGYLESWQLRQQLLSQRLKGESLEDALPLLKATGSLPHGEIGQQLFYDEVDKVNKFAVRLTDYPEQFIGPISFELSLSEFSLMGQLDDCSVKGLFNYRLSKAKGGDLLSIWCGHLVLNCLRPQGVLCESRWVTEDIDIKLKPVDDPESLLLGLLEVYWQGCQQAIPLFSKTSFAYAKAFLKNGKGEPDTAMMKSWKGNKHTPGEMDDNYYQQLYKTTPLNDEFKKLAIAIYKPIYDHLEDPDKW
jgi:exodeoxyribonuclease V gamma subunit